MARHRITHVRPWRVADLALIVIAVTSIIAVQSPLLANEHGPTGAAASAGEDSTGPAADAGAEPAPSEGTGPPADPAPPEPAKERQEGDGPGAGGAGADGGQPQPDGAAPAAGVEDDRPQLRKPWIESDKDDYAPGEEVVLTSGNWQPDEKIHLVVNDDEGATWKRDLELVADGAGTFVDAFELPAWFVATYTAVATGELSGVASVTFTDAVVATASVDRSTATNGATGVVSTFTVNNVSTASEQLRSVRIGRPGTFATITACSNSLGWSGALAADSCTFNGGSGTAIGPGGSATFAVTMTLAAGDNASGTWSVRVHTSGTYASSGSVAATGSLGLTSHAFAITDVVVGGSASAVGGGCPSSNKTAPAASARVFVICGINGTGSTATPVSGQSSLSGSMVGAPGTFGGGTLANSSSAQVLANWTVATVSGAAGSGKTAAARIGSSSSRTSQLATFGGYEATANGATPSGSVVVQVLTANDRTDATRPGDDVTFTATIANSGTTKITITKITDTFGEPPTTLSICNGTGPGSPNLVGTSLAPGGSTVCTFKLTNYAPAVGETIHNTIRVEAFSLEPLGRFLIADEDSIENKTNAYLNSDLVPQTWSVADVNDGSLGSGTESGPNAARRSQLKFFEENIGATITIPAGSSSDPGLFELTGVLRTTENLASCSGTGHWADRGPTDSALRNFIGDPASAWPHGVGPGLGTGADPEKCLDKVPFNPLDTVVELQALIGQTVCIVAKDSDVSTAGTGLASLQGGYLGTAAFSVNSLLLPGQPGFPGVWDSTIRGLNITILDAREVCGIQTGFGATSSFMMMEALPSGSLDVIKAFDGAGSPAADARFTIEVDCGDIQESLEFDANGDLVQGTLPLRNIPEGTQCSVQETANGGAESVGYSPNGGTVTIVADQTQTVTVTNTFTEATIQVAKDFSPESDQGTVDLFIKDGDGQAIVSTSGAGHGGATPATSVPAGRYSVGEAEGTISLSDYHAEISCRDAGGAEVAEGSGSDLSLTVADGEQVTCTITNIRKTGKIEVVKALEPADDPGEFELLIQDGEGSMVGSTGPVGHHGSTGSVELPTGTYTVAERAGGASSLGDYHSDISCDPRQGDAGALALSEGDATVVLGSGDDVVCTITNTRKTGRIEVVKVLEPAGDPGEFDLFIEDSEGSTVGSTTPVGHLGSTGPVQIPTGTYTVGERAAPGTSLDDYGRGIVCGPREGDGAGALGDSGDGPVQDEIVTVADGDDILCTITNTRLGSITVTTETDPADARSANFTYSGTGTDMPQHLTLDTAADDDTNPSTFMVAGLLPGSYSISATDVPAGWTLQGLECVGGDGTSADAGTGVASIELSGGEDVECTFSHGRTPLSGTVVKTNDADLQGAFSHQEVASAAGQSVRFQLVITNTSPVPVTIEAIKDTFAGSTVDVPECLDASAANAVGMELSRGGSDGDAVTCRFTLARYAPASNSQLLNTAGVVLRDEFSSFSVTDTSVVTTPELPAREDDDDDDTRDSGNGIDNDARPALLAEEPQRPGGLALTGVRLWFLLLFSLALMVAGFAAREKAGSEA